MSLGMAVLTFAGTQRVERSTADDPIEAAVASWRWT